MSFRQRILLLALLFFSINYSAYSQGCSDAGFCTMGAMRPNQSFPKRFKAKMVSLEMGQYYGYTKFQTHVFTYFADMNIAVGPKTSIQVKVPYTIVRGELGSAHDFGDISYSATRNLVRNDKYQLNVTLGGKIPTNNSNLTSNFYGHNNLVMPMYYQTSLGTYDIVLGGSVITRKWLFAVGYQEALNSNKSTFIRQNWENADPAANEYPESYHLKRGNDVMLRVERNFRSSKFNGYVGLLPIYRINKDVVTDSLGQRVKAPGSNGLALNMLFGAGYNLSTRSAIKFLIALAPISRQHNPDGLSRIFVNSISYEIRF